MNEINKEILEVLDEDLAELKQEIADKKVEIAEKEQEIEDNEDYEVDDYEVDDDIDSCYGEVEVAGVKYETSRAMKALDDGSWEDWKNAMVNRIIEENRDELEVELEDLQGELEELEDQYEYEFEDNDDE